MTRKIKPGWFNVLSTTSDVDEAVPGRMTSAKSFHQSWRATPTYMSRRGRGRDASTNRPRCPFFCTAESVDMDEENNATTNHTNQPATITTATPWPLIRQIYY